MDARRALILAALIAALAAADPPDPAAYRAEVMRDQGLARERGEQFCWVAAYHAGHFLLAYEAWRDPRWLDEAVAFDDFCVGKLEKDPDGDEGWIGPPITDQPDLVEDALVGDAVACGHLVAFAELVLADPALAERFGAKARGYVELATRVVWEKWNRRGCWRQDRSGWGGYTTYGRSIDARTRRWVERPDSVLSQPLNKSFDAAIVLLRLWRITGQADYRERAERIFGRGQMLLRHWPDGDRVSWNYWTPQFACDIDGRAPKHWVGVHEHRPGYQVGEVAMMVEAYDSGLVYDRADLERLIRANRWMAPQGERKDWRSSDGTSAAGDLWPALARFDEATSAELQRRLADEKGARGEIARAYFAAVTAKQTGWDRRRARPGAKASVGRAPLQPGRALAFALPIPDVVETLAGGRARLACKAMVGGTLTIELMDAEGKRALSTLATIAVAKDGEYAAPRWDGTNPKTGKKDRGAYRVRWTLDGESRSEPIWVEPGTKRAPAGPPPLAPGERLAVDFESPLDARWRIDGAQPSAEQAHGGATSLKLVQGQSATLRFGSDDDLPVRVSLWVHDAGAKLGRASATGGGWGVKGADGDVFALRPCWRSYLDGDAGYAWFDTGENQWFSPRPANVPRAAGWSEWVFDLRDRAQAAVTGGGAAVGEPIGRHLPGGAIALCLVGGDEAAGPLYVDDVRVERAPAP